MDFQCPESVVAVSNSILNLGSCQLLWAGDSGSPSISAHVARVATFPIVYPEEPLVTPSLFHPMLNREAESNGRLLDFSIHLDLETFRPRGVAAICFFGVLLSQKSHHSLC